MWYTDYIMNNPNSILHNNERHEKSEWDQLKSEQQRSIDAEEYLRNNPNQIDDLVRQSSSVEQLELLNALSRIHEGRQSDRKLRGQIEKTLWDTQNDSESSPLARIVSRRILDACHARNVFYAHLEDIEMFAYYYGASDIPEAEKSGALPRSYDAERMMKRRNSQEQLHKEFPNLPSDKRLAKISPDVIAFITEEPYSIEMLVDRDGENLYDSIEDERGIKLIKIAHEPIVKELIDEKLGLDLSRIPLDSQIQLLNYMAEADGERFDNLCRVMQEKNENVRYKLLINFFQAKDFGMDFCDALLEMAESEHIDDEQLAEFLDNMDTCRTSIKNISEIFFNFDKGEFSKEFSKAALERLNDAIMTFRAIAKDGFAEADLGWAGKPKMLVAEAAKALEFEAKSLSIIDGIIDNILSGERGAFVERIIKPPKTDYHSSLNRSSYVFYSPKHGYMLLNVRTEGSSSFDNLIDYGRTANRYNENAANVGTEASIGITVDPISPFSYPNPYKSGAVETKNKVSAIRIDREGRAPGMAANDSSRTPIAKIGMVSVDLAAIGDKPDTPSGQIARLFSIGNKLHMSSLGSETSALNHNTNWFNQGKYGTEDGFRALAEYVDRGAVALEFLRSPKKSIRKLGKAAIMTSGKHN